MSLCVVVVLLTLSALCLVCTIHSVACGELIVGEYCHAEIFRATCADNEVILMERALYGRMSLGRCVELDMGHLGCQTDVLALADRRCSGRRSCLIRVPDAELESGRPCLRELKTYLFVSYRCVQVATVTSIECRAGLSPPALDNTTSGYLASVVLSDTPSCNDGRQTWTIRAETGQQISLKLYDFYAEQPTPAPPSGRQLNHHPITRGIDVFCR